jgi:adenylosuccinate lyase
MKNCQPMKLVGCLECLYDSGFRGSKTKIIQHTHQRGLQEYSLKGIERPEILIAADLILRRFNIFIRITKFGIEIIRLKGTCLVAT